MDDVKILGQALLKFCIMWSPVLLGIGISLIVLISSEKDAEKKGCKNGR